MSLILQLKEYHDNSIATDIKSTCKQEHHDKEVVGLILIMTERTRWEIFKKKINY